MDETHGSKENGVSKNITLQVNGVSKPNIASDDLPKPKVVLFPPEDVVLDWKKITPIGSGLVNLGNTCFMNSVLQCLTYCPPLVNYLLGDNEHSRQSCSNFCMACLLSCHIKRCFENTGSSVRPFQIAQKLKAIARHFQFGRQEDAHEYLRHLIDSMCRTSVSSFESRQQTKLDSCSKETTAFNQIFGGYLRSQVTCLECHTKSDTFDHFMDFMLEVKNVISVEKALERFTRSESLQDDNAYKCPKCKKRTSATKRFSVHQAPNIATIQLKRFEYNRFFGGKITKHISFPEMLDLRPYMSDTKGERIMYRLNAVLVHFGSSCNSGHYYCFVRNSNGSWFLMDDTRVSSVGLNHVLNQNAYILFYVRRPLSSQTNGALKRSSELFPTPSTTSTSTPKQPTSLPNKSLTQKLNNGPRLISESHVPAKIPAIKIVSTTVTNGQLISSLKKVEPSPPIPRTETSVKPPQIEENKPEVHLNVVKNLVPYDESDSSSDDGGQEVNGKAIYGVGHILSQAKEVLKTPHSQPTTSKSLPHDQSSNKNQTATSSLPSPFEIGQSHGLSSLGTNVTSWEGQSNHVDEITKREDCDEKNSDDELDIGRVSSSQCNIEIGSKGF